MKLNKESRCFLSSAFILILSIPIAFYTPPETYDLSRHYDTYNIYFSTHNTDLLDSYFGFSYLIQLLVLFELPAQSMAFICSLLFLFSIFKLNSFVSYGAADDTVGKIFSLSYFISGIVPFFVFNYLALMSGLRFSIAVSFFILAVLADYRKNNKTSIIYHILAVSFHFALFGLVLLFYLSKKIHIKNVQVRISLFICGLIFSQFINVFSEYIMDAINLLQLTDEWAYKANLYLFGEWGSQANEALNSNGLVIVYASKAITYFLFFVFLIYGSSINIAHNNDFVSLCAMLLSYFSAFYTLSGRFESVVICFLFLPIGMKLVKFKKLRHYEWFMLMLLFLRGCIQYVNIRDEYLRLLMFS